MNKKVLSLLIAVVMVLATVPAALSIPAVTATPVSQTDKPHQVTTEVPNNFIPGEVLKKEIQKVLESSGETVRLIVAPDKEHAMDVYNALKKLGTIDPISRPEYQFIVVEMPISNVEKLEEIPGILHVWKDRMVKLEEPAAYPEVGAPSANVDIPNVPDMFMSIFTIRAYDTWVDYGVYGDNVTVAVLDTGVDVGHPFLQTTLDGRRKIVDVYDASDEGIAEIYYSTTATSDGYITVNMTVPVYWGAYYDYYGHEMFTNYTMGTYYVGGINGTEYYLGLLPERYFDLNNFHGTPNDPYELGLFGDLSDVYPVLIVNQSGKIVAYIDFDLDNNFTNDQPMGLYDLTGDYVQISPTKVDVAFARFEWISDNITDLFTIPADDPLSAFLWSIFWGVPNYQGQGMGLAMFMWDAHGHGTHVSGTVAGVGLPTDPVFNETYGMAPNAQLMEVKVLPGEIGFGRTSWIINGMFYAALHGADVISMSLGGGGEINDGLDPEDFYVNLITDWFGVTFAIAAGNEGPTTNSVHSPGDSDLAITVGNYVDNERESFWYGTDLGIIAGPSMSSSRGPRDDGMIDPDVMAPGTDIFSSLPMWYTVLENDPYYYYGIWSGTSMATPHVSGAVALMISYAKAHGLNYNPIMIKRALEMSAKPVDGTLIDQGFGLIQVDKAIETLKQLSQEPTTYIFAGTTYTSFKNPIEQPLIPISQAYVDFNGYFQNIFGFPYLYRGVYLRNEYPGSVPIYFSPLVYEPGWGLRYVLEDKTYHISTNVDWIIPSTTEVTINGAEAEYVSDLIGQFSINIDYSKLQKSGVYVGLVYIDDPETSYIDGYVPVIVEIPMNKNDETHVKLSDTEKPGEAKHYFVEVPRGTTELRITLRVPADASGVPMGRTKLVIARPLGGVVYDGVPGYYYVGANPSGNIYEYTWVVENPVEGTWEITAYSSVFAKYWSGYDTSHYEIEIEMSNVEMEPKLITKDVSEPGTVSVEAKAINNYETVNTEVVGYGMGRLDVAYGAIRAVNQSEWDIIGVLPVDQSTYFIRFGITQPEDPSADLDLYVYYFPTYDDLLSFTNYIVYYDQIGPTSDEVFEKFMPEPGYYLVAVYGYDTAGHNPIHYTFYYQALGDNGDITIPENQFEFDYGAEKSIVADVTVEDEGTYLGVIGLINNDTGNVLTYAPVMVQVGKPSMTMIVATNATLGKLSEITLKFLDSGTQETIDTPIKVIINGRPYYTDNGVLEVYYVPTHLHETLEITAINDYYTNIEKTITISAKEPFDKEIHYTTQVVPEVISGFGKLVSYENFGNRLRITVDGPSGYTGYVLVPLPYSSDYVKVEGEGVINYYHEIGSMATYLIVEVQYGSPVTFTVDFVPVKPAVSGLNYFYYSRFVQLNQTFAELYQKAIELGVDNETLQMALDYQQAAEAWYREGLEYMNPKATSSGVLALIRFRRAYVSIRDAIRILENAIGELENSEG